MRRHIEYQNWVAVYDGLSPVQRQELDDHIQECQDCASDLAAYQQMDVDIRGLRSLKAGAGVRVRFTEMAGAHATPQPAPARAPIPKAPVIASQKRVRQPWTPARLLLPVGALVLFIAAVWLGMRVPDRRGPAVEQAAAVPPASAAVTEIIFHCESIMEWGALSKVVSDFEAENPDLRVKFTSVSIFGTDEESYHAAMKQASEAADVFCAMPSPTELGSGVATDLAPFIEADASFRPDDFYPGLLFRWGETTGATLSVPTYFDLGLIAYKPAAFDEAGLPNPQPGWTWDDFLRVAIQLTQRQGDEVVRWGFSEVGTGIINRRLMSEWSSDWQVGPSYAAMANILAWYETLYIETQAAPAPITLGWEAGKTYNVGDDLDQYRNGNKSAMWDASWTGTASVGRRVPYPESRPGEPQMPMSTLAGLVMSGQTAHPEASWRWISYLSQHLPEGEHIQARRSLAERASFWSKLDPASAAAYRYGLDHLATFPGKLPADYAAQMEAVVTVVQAEKTAAQALADLAAQGRLRRAPGTPAPEQTVIVTYVTATPAVPSGWQREGDEALDVQFRRPESWEKCQDTELSRLFCEKVSAPGENPLAPPAFYMTLLPPGFMNEGATAYNWWSPDELAAAFNTAVGERFTSSQAPAGYNSYTRLPDVMVDGFTGAVVESEPVWEAPAGTKDRRVLIRLGDAVCVLGTYYGTEAELHTFEQVVTSFRIGTTLRTRAPNIKGGD